MTTINSLGAIPIAQLPRVDQTHLPRRGEEQVDARKINAAFEQISRRFNATNLNSMFERLRAVVMLPGKVEPYDLVGFSHNEANVDIMRPKGFSRRDSRWFKLATVVGCIEHGTISADEKNKYTGLVLFAPQPNIGKRVIGQNIWGLWTINQNPSCSWFTKEGRIISKADLKSHPIFFPKNQTPSSQQHWQGEIKDPRVTTKVSGLLQEIEGQIARP